MLVIENVGNLLCPTGWDLGEDAKVVVASLPEGPDKPLKYPMAFATAQAAVINKVDLEPYIPAKSARLRYVDDGRASYCGSTAGHGRRPSRP